MHRTRTTQRIIQKLYEAIEDEDRKNKIKLVLDGGNFIFFFKYKENIYGTGESGRVTFAKMKDSQDEENTDAWRKEANFIATNLNDMMLGKQNQTIFGEKECNEIDVIADKDKVFSDLIK